MTYILSDIHGNRKAFRALLDKINLSIDDQLYILGDVIDRGPDGICLLSEIMNTPNCVLLLGNHEHMMLNCLAKPAELDTLITWFLNGGDSTYSDFLKLSPDMQANIYEYLRSLPINIWVSIEGRNFILCHGTPVDFFDVYPNCYRDPTTYTVWTRMKPYMKSDGKTIIFGHTATCQYQKGHPMRVWFGEDMIGIDCGSGYDGGRLACLRLEDMSVFYSDL